MAFKATNSDAHIEETHNSHISKSYAAGGASSTFADGSYNVAIGEGALKAEWDTEIARDIRTINSVAVGAFAGSIVGYEPDNYSITSTPNAIPESLTNSVAIGFLAGTSDGGTREQSVMIGSGAARMADYVFNSVIIGSDACQFSGTASNAVVIGEEAGAFAGQLSEAVVIGAGAGGGLGPILGQTFQNSAASQYSTIVGARAARYNQTGHVTAFGYFAASSLTTGTQSTFIGGSCGISSTTGSLNTFVGHSSADNITTGYQNVVVGATALDGETTGYENVVIGHNALALTSNLGRNRNTVIGKGAGSTLCGASNNTVIGYNANSTSATVNNEITLGNSSITTLRCQVTSITSLSDERDKSDVQDLSYGLNLINELRPVEFVWNMRDGGKTGVPDIGFVAQEIAKVEDGYGDHERLALTYRENPDKLEASYGRLVPVLVKAVQELSNQLDELKSKLKDGNNE